MSRHSYKIALVGKPKSGKTSFFRTIIVALTGDDKVLETFNFFQDYDNTIIHRQKMQFLTSGPQPKIVELELWDFPGLESINSCLILNNDSHVRYFIDYIKDADFVVIFSRHGEVPMEFYLEYTKHSIHNDNTRLPGSKRCTLVNYFRKNQLIRFSDACPDLSMDVVEEDFDSHIEVIKRIVARLVQE